MAVMRSALIHEFGKDVDEGIGKITVGTVPRPSGCRDQQVVVSVKACCINFPDLMNTANAHQHKQSLPFVPGMEYAGVIKAVGGKVKKFKVGDRVIVSGKGMVEETVVHQNECNLMPQHYTFCQGASFTVGYTTAYHCLVERAALQPGETVLIHGATGGMGMAALHIAKAIGAKVIATGGADNKLEVVKSQGADHVINYNSQPKFAKAVKDLTGGEGAHVVYDPVGGEVLKESLSAARWGGRVLIVGFTSNERPPLPSANILIKGLSVMGCRAGEFIRRTADGVQVVALPRMKQLWEWAHAGKLTPYVSHEYTLDQVQEAFRCVQRRVVIGRACVNFELGQGQTRSSL